MSWVITKSEWPNCPTGSIGLHLPFVYGRHDSSGLSGTGMLPAIAVDYTAGVIGWYACCAGEAKEITDVYVDGVLKTGGGTDYTRSYAVSRAGKVYTVVKFVNIPSAAAVVTVDLQGYESTGNTAVTSTPPTGACILNPVEQIRHFLLNHAEKLWMAGPWYAVEASAFLDVDSWADAAQWAEAQQLEGAGYVGGGMEAFQVGDVFNEWLQTWPMFRGYWTAAGRLGLRVIRLTHPGYRGTTDHPILRSEHDLGGADYAQDTNNLTDEIQAQYLYDEVQSQYLASLSVIDPDAGSGISSATDAKWSVRRAT